MAKKFNLADFVQAEGVSKMDTPEIELLPWEKIHGNAANFYTVDDVDELVKSIELHGLLDPVVVMPDPEAAGAYVLVSGHRRHKAWGILRSQDPVKYAEIPAIVREFVSVQMAELALIMANASARELSGAEIDQQAARTEALLYELKEQGYEFSGRMRDQVAAACKVSASRLARLKVIREKLHAPWSQMWKKGELVEATAYELAQAPEELQARIFKVWKDTTANGVARVRKIYEAGHDYACADLTGPGCGKCTHGDAFLRHDLEEYSTCEGVTCCLKCEKASRYYPCGRMCSKAKARRKMKNDKEKAREQAARDERYAEIRGRIQESAARLVRAADASGAADEVAVKTRYGSVTVGQMRKICTEGDFGHMYTYFNELEVDEGLNAGQAARALGCSADYICGLTDELHGHPAEGLNPAPAVSNMDVDEDPDGEIYMALSWKAGEPPAAGRYLAVIGDTEGKNCTEFTVEWSGDAWLVFDKPIMPWMKVRAWWPLPAKYEEDEDGEE
ncbi:MAG: ParB N-terminal domain-containing protein [Oscillospiraceae bacterium]|nr:ParB N-terminal domain-containing protein [Oscillospiraceae bacterium]MBQ2633449.1 ParB N-terminal domain-containing protein [Oscillospiraceae bacterium]